MSYKYIAPSTLQLEQVSISLTKKYVMTLTNVQQLQSFLTRQSLNADYLYNDQSEYVISLRAYPLLDFTSWLTLGTYGVISIGPFGTSETGVSATPVTKVKNWVKIATIPSTQWTIHHDNYLTFRQKVTIYLPYVKFVEIDIMKVFGKNIGVYYSIDFDTGELLAVIYDDDNQNVIHTETSHIGIDIELNRTNAENIVRNIYFTTLGTTATAMGLVGATAVAKAPALTLGMGIAGMTSSLVNNLAKGSMKDVFHGGVGTGKNNLILPTSVVVIMQYDETVESDSNFAHYHGLPLMTRQDLSSLSGFTVVKDIHFEVDKATLEYDSTPSITTNEIDLIVSKLKEGVYL